MFEHLDDPHGTDIPPIEPVLERGGHLRRRRQIATASGVGAIVVVLVASVMSVAAGGTDHHVTVATHDTSTINGPSTTAARASSSTTVAPTTTTTPRRVVVLPAHGTPTTTTTIPHDPSDLSQVTVHFDRPSLTMSSGDVASLPVTLTNTGSWTVAWHGPETSCPYQAGAPNGGPPQYDPLWPIPPVGPTCDTSSQSEHMLAPGASITETAPIAAGLVDAHTNVVPGRAGNECFSPFNGIEYPIIPQGGGAEACPVQTLPITITAPATAPFHTDRPTQVTVASGTEQSLAFTLTNDLAFPVSFLFEGAPTIPADGGASACAGGTTPPAWACQVTVGAHATLQLHLDVWATTDLAPPSADNTALAPGTHTFEWSGIPLRVEVTGAS